MTSWLIAGLLAAALYFLWTHRRNRILGGLPVGQIIAADNEEQECPVMISQRYGLKGKPDALVRTKEGHIIPVERKKSRAPHQPYEGDLIQALAYALLVEETYGQTAPYVRIQYADRVFDVPFTQAHRVMVLNIAIRLREARRAGPSTVLTASPPNAATAHSGNIAGRRCDFPASRKG